MPKTILIIEDEQTIVDILKFHLEREGYACEYACDGQEGLRMALSLNPDLILLDIMLPVLDGFEVCRSLRGRGVQTPVVMLTAREDEADKVFGLELGADDYVTKPFSLAELSARIKANIRRTAEPADGALPRAAHGEPSNELCYGGLTLHLGRMEAYRDGGALELTQREYDLLQFLAQNADQVFSREELLERVWNYEYYGDLRTVDVTVRRLRGKIEENPAEPRYIVTRRGAGYLFKS
ncbi:MAG: response regulator transcription factor [Oscillospiraceae bacterium]|nr:response regulator transcription factor [Oscillospiraceae bacterium]